jgi:FemAB-related protein (PEP-CTERM system-associated)
LPSVFECNDASKWNLLLEDNPSANAYLLWEYGEALCQTYPYKRHYLACDSSGSINGALPLIHIKSRLFGNRLISLPFCEYGGPIFKSGLAQQEVADVWESLLNAGIDLTSKLEADYIELRQPSLDELTLIDKNFERLQSYVTFRTDLTKDEKELWSSLDKKTRNAVRKAQKSRLEIDEAKGPDQLKEYFVLYLKTQKRLGSPPHSFKLFLNLFSAFSTNKKIRMFIARHEGVPIAGITVFLHGNSVFWWNNVSDTEHRSLNPTNLLLWHTMQWAVDDGYKLMDLGRTRKPSTIYDFKSRWGGEEKPLKDYVRFMSAGKKNLPDPSQRKYQFLSAIWDLLPVAVTRRIGPRIIQGIGL